MTSGAAYELLITRTRGSCGRCLADATPRREIFGAKSTPPPPTSACTLRFRCNKRAGDKTNSCYADGKMQHAQGVATSWQSKLFPPKPLRVRGRSRSARAKDAPAAAAPSARHSQPDGTQCRRNRACHARWSAVCQRRGQRWLPRGWREPLRLATRSECNACRGSGQLLPA